MLPPLDPSLLHNNPKFAAFYKRLSVLLDDDGSISPPAEEAERRTKLQEAFFKAQKAAVKTDILRFTLARLYLSDLSSELLDLITLISTPPLTSQEPNLRHLLSNSDFDLSSLGSLASRELSSLASQLFDIASLSSKEPYTVEQISARKQELKDAEIKLYNVRLELSGAADAACETSREVLQTTIKTLEGVKYGSVARAEITEARYYATVAEGLDEKLSVVDRTITRVIKLEALQAIYDPNVRRALANYNEHLNQVKLQLTARGRAAQQKLDEYEEAGRGMSVLATRYADLAQELESVKSQILRLEGQD
ncbi:MAG: hypothetical protein Q9191_006827 [Dirinaria sp. TL-2023a]